MATKKQRRRREKLQRHEYEYVVETEEGEEVVATPRAATKSGSERTTQGKEGKVIDRRGREIKPPSWSRVLKRGAIFGPILFVLMFVLDQKTSVASKTLTVLFMLLIFLPFSYLTDRFLYRAVAKRQRRDSGR